MSSSSRLPGDRRRALLAALTVAACIAQWLGAMGAGATELSIVTVVPPAQDRQVTLVADVRPAGSTPLPPTAFSVTSGDATLPTSAAPVVSDELALSLVVDASPDGAATLQQGLSGMTSFLLQMPVAARVAAVADSSPPTVLTSLRPGAKDALRALDRLRGGGPRRTSDAIDLALRQLPDDPGPRVLLLLTSAPNAGGADEDPAVLSGRLRQAHALLAVVSTSADASYWARVTADTGGILVAPQSTDLLTAFETVADTLRSRYVLTFAAPRQLPGFVSVRVRTTAGTLKADAFIAGGSAPAAPAEGHGSFLRLLAIGLAVAAVPIGAWVLLRARPGAGSRSDGAGRIGQRGPPSRRAQVGAAAEAPAVAAGGELADIERPRLRVAGPPSAGPATPPVEPRRVAAPPAERPAALPAAAAARPAAERGEPPRAGAPPADLTSAAEPLSEPAPSAAEAVAEPQPAEPAEPAVAAAPPAGGLAEPPAAEPAEPAVAAAPPAEPAAAAAPPAAGLREPPPAESPAAEPPSGEPVEPAVAAARPVAGLAEPPPGARPAAEPSPAEPAEPAAAEPPPAEPAVAAAAPAARPAEPPPAEPPPAELPAAEPALAAAPPAGGLAEPPAAEPAEPATAAATPPAAEPATAAATPPAAESPSEPAPSAAEPAPEPPPGPAAPTPLAPEPATAAAPLPISPVAPVTAAAPGAAVSPGEDERAYAHLDAQAANAAAAVKTGRLDRRRAVARIALAARGRIDLVDRLIDTERRMVGTRLATWSGTGPVLELLATARRVVSGDLTLAGPGGVRVEQAAPSGAEPSGGAVLRLTRNGQWVRDCHSADDLSRDVDVTTLQVDNDAQLEQPDQPDRSR